MIAAECLKAGTRQDGTTRQHWRVRLEDRPKAWVRTVRIGGRLELDGGASERAPAQPAPIATYEWRARATNPAPIAGLPAHGKHLVLGMPTTDGEYYVTLRIADEQGRSDESTAMIRVRGGTPEAADPDRDHPAWVDQAVIYGVIPSRYGPDGLRGVTARLDDLKALGIGAIWLSPITVRPPDDFGYAITDPFRLDPRAGTPDDLRTLVTQAHARGLRIIMDFPPNHVSEQHAYFADAAARRHRSPYYDMFDRSETGEPTHYFDWRNLKNLNFDHPEVQQLIIAAFGYWVREFDVDGFRVDAAWGPRQRAPEFWPRWRAELKRIKPDLLLLAEASARDPYYLRHGFDVAYDWTDTLGEWAWREAFEDTGRTARRLRAAIAASMADRHAPVFRFLNNNDTGARFITRHGPARTRVATAMLLTLPGVPSLYVGDEIGAAFEPYGGGPPIEWTDPHDLRRFHARLIALRRQHSALRSRDIRLLDLAPQDQLLAYVRPGPKPSGSVLVLLNYGPTALDVPLTAEARGLIGTSALRDLLSGEHVAAGAHHAIPIAGYGIRVLAFGGN
jgi:glycosidase